MPSVLEEFGFTSLYLWSGSTLLAILCVVAGNSSKPILSVRSWRGEWFTKQDSSPFHHEAKRRKMEKTEKMVKTDWISEAVNLSVHMLDQESRHTFLKVFRDQVEYFTFSSEATKAKDLLKVRLINVWRAKRAMGGRRRPRSSCRRQRIAIVVIMIWYVSPNGEKIGLVPPPLHTGLPYTWFTPPGWPSVFLKKTHNVSGDAAR